MEVGFSFSFFNLWTNSDVWTLLALRREKEDLVYFSGFFLPVLTSSEVLFSLSYCCSPKFLSHCRPACLERGLSFDSIRRTKSFQNCSLGGWHVTCDLPPSGFMYWTLLCYYQNVNLNLLCLVHWPVASGSLGLYIAPKWMLVLQEGILPLSV